MILGDLIKLGSFRIYGSTVAIILLFIFNLFYWHRFTKKNECKPIYTLKIKEREIRAVDGKAIFLYHFND